MATATNGNENANEVANPSVDPKEKQQINEMFATPLIGQFLNLPREPVVIKCPACDKKELSLVENDMKWWAVQINQIFSCFFITFCCCCCFNYYIPCKQTDRNHYCKNCGCYFGRCMKHKQIQISKKK